MAIQHLEVLYVGKTDDSNTLSSNTAIALAYT
jgi:hypothetical protein